MLLSLLSLVVLLGLASVFIVLHKRASDAAKSAHTGASSTESTVSLKSSLKRPTCWLAIRQRDIKAVQSALTLHNLKPCPCREGLIVGNEQKLFVSPPIQGWILVVGSALPDPVEDVDVCFRFLLELSRKLGHVQYFKSNLVLNHHAWAKMESGRVIRGYAWAGHTLWNQGECTPAEAQLRLKSYNYGEAADHGSFWSSSPSAANAEKVHSLAAEWSIDPESIDDRFTENAIGVVGEPVRLV
jgi:hypothetical protein